MNNVMCWAMINVQICGYFIHRHTAIVHHDGFSCCNRLVSQRGVPDLSGEHLPQKSRCFWTSYSTRTLAAVINMPHHTGLSFADGFH
jgi:hypothetical protein